MTMHELLADRGARFATQNGRHVPRHFGDPAAEYAAATRGCGLVWRTDRDLLRVHGRAPAQMLQGIATNRVPAPPVPAQPGALAAALAGEVVYGTLLTAKGRMVTDQKMFWLGAGTDDGVGLDIAAEARAATLAHFARFLPPRMARTEDLSERAGLLSVTGADAREVVAAAFGSAPSEGAVLLDDGPLAGGILLARGVEQVSSWDIWVGADQLANTWRQLEKAGAMPVGGGVWETLRVEAGFPRYGAEMTDRTIPIEAGLGDRAFDHEKGCYTGQEVIVRIRHRGRVNWHLRALRMGSAAAAPGDQLFQAEGTKPRGRITSVVESPRFGQVIGLGYVRREVVPPAVLRLGSGAGPRVTVEVPGPDRASD